jgi:hypothetical protein
VLDTPSAVSVVTVRQALQDQGFDADELAHDVRPRTSFARARQALKQRRILCEVEETADRCLWQLSEAYRREQRLDFRYAGQVWYDKTSQTVAADTAELHQRIIELFQHYSQVFVPNDLTKIFCSALEASFGLLKLRHRGGVYFVPALADERILGWTNAVEAIGARCLRFTVYGGDRQVREAILESVVSDVKARIEQIKNLIATEEQTTGRKARGRLKALVAEIGKLRTFANAADRSVSELTALVSDTEVSLGLLATSSLDALATLAQNGEGGLVAKLAAIAQEDGGLPDLGAVDVAEPVVVPTEQAGAMDLPAIEG